MGIEAPDRVVARVKQRIVENADGCWIWQGSLSGGYGHVGWQENGIGHWKSAHRILYEAEIGPIPEAHDLDHLCHDPAKCAPKQASDCPHRACCNPAHLSPATRRQNLLRGGTISAERRAVTHCPQGHEYTEANTIESTKGQRSCRTCSYERNRAYYWKNRERRAEYNRQWRQRNIKTPRPKS
jgi:hypothetical protein